MIILIQRAEDIHTLVRVALHFDKVNLLKIHREGCFEGNLFSLRKKIIQPFLCFLSLTIC